MERKMLKCGCAAQSTHQNDHDGLGENHPSCVIHETCEVIDTPNFSGRRARCEYFGKPVKVGMYNANACDKCSHVKDCACEEDSSPKLWFFEFHPNKEYDEFYCACHGAD